MTIECPQLNCISLFWILYGFQTILDFFLQKCIEPRLRTSFVVRYVYLGLIVKYYSHKNLLTHENIFLNIPIDTPQTYTYVYTMSFIIIDALYFNRLLMQDLTPYEILGIDLSMPLIRKSETVGTDPTISWFPIIKRHTKLDYIPILLSDIFLYRLRIILILRTPLADVNSKFWALLLHIKPYF